jgi:uncharacterized protein (TIGR02271 family)
VYPARRISNNARAGALLCKVAYSTPLSPGGQPPPCSHVVGLLSPYDQTVSVPVSHEEVRLEREPITDGNVGDALDGPDISEEEHEVVLTEERPVIAKETVPVERVRIGTETKTDTEQVSAEVRKEEIELEDDTTHYTDR